MPSYLSLTQAGTEGEFPCTRFQAYLHSQHSAWETSRPLGIFLGHSTTAPGAFSWPIFPFWHIQTQPSQGSSPTLTLGKPCKLSHQLHEAAALRGALLCLFSEPKKSFVAFPMEPAWISLTVRREATDHRWRGSRWKLHPHKYKQGLMQGVKQDWTWGMPSLQLTASRRVDAAPRTQPCWTEPRCQGWQPQLHLFWASWSWTSNLSRMRKLKRKQTARIQCLV